MQLVQIYFNFLNKIKIITGTNFLAFFICNFYFSPSWIRICILNADPDPQP